MEYEVADRILVVPPNEADIDDTLTQHTLNADGDLGLVG